MLGECRRILAPRGVLRVIVPDAGKVIRAYVNEPELLVRRRDPSTGLPMEAVNSWAYQRYEHQCLYDWPLMARTLEDAGFVGIALRSYGDGSIPALTIDDAKYEWESLYVEACQSSPWPNKKTHSGHPRLASRSLTGSVNTVREVGSASLHS